MMGAPGRGPLPYPRSPVKFSALDKLEKLEAFRANPYLCSAGHWTVGIGHKMTQSEISSGKIIINGMACRPPLTHDQGLALKLQDLKPIEEDFGATLAGIPLTQNQYDALVIFAFNCGVPAFKGSTLLKKLRAGAPTPEIQKEIRKWNKARNVKTGLLEVNKGLINRRKFEADLYAAPA